MTDTGFLIGAALIAIALLALSLTIAAFWLKQIVLAVGGAFAWLLLAAFGYINASGDLSSIYFYIFFFGIAMTVTMSVESILIRQSHREETGYESEEREYKRHERAEPKAPLLHPMDRVRAKHEMAPSEARERRKINNRTGW